MGNICEHEFEIIHKDNPMYSVIEYDLYARTGLTIRKNMKTQEYEIVTIKKPRIIKHRSKSIFEIVRIANDIEGAENTKVECGIGCPLTRR